MEDTELPEPGENTYRLRVFAVVFSLRDEIGAVAIRSAATRQRPVDDPFRRRKYRDVDTGKGNPIAGRDDRMFGALVQRPICRTEKLSHSFVRLDTRSVVDEASHRNLARQLLHRSVVVAVPVGGDQVVDLSDARVRHRVHDATGIPRCILSTVSSIDQQGLPARRDEQGRTPTLDVDQIYLESLLRLCLRLHGGQRETHEKGE